MGEFNGKKRSELPDSVFGIPQERKYPMPDEKHTRSAIKLFNHVEPKYEEQLAKAVIKNMKKYGIDGSVVGPNNRLRKYLPKDMIKESYIEESVSSAVSKDHKQKGYIKLSSLKRTHITEFIINKYKKEYPVLRHVRCKDTDEYVCDGYMWFKENDLVCYVGSCQYTDDNTKWIVSLEILPEYRGYGLSNQILDFCIKNMKCRYLSVNKNNELAKKIYDKYGFKTYHEDKTMYYMTLDNISSSNESMISTTEKAKYDPPYTAEEVKRVYGTKVYKELIKDPAHKYRMDSGIELIHKEPTKEELERIWKNWNLMSDDQKMKSDKKSMELFGKTNQDHYNELINSYVVNESYIEEGYFKSTDNLEFNLNKWSKSGPHNLLYITGISGSGKTTLAKEMCKRYKAEYIELDKFTLGIVKGLDRWFENVSNGTYEVHPLLKEYFSQLDHLTTNGSWSKPDMGDEHTKFLTWLVNKVKGNGTLYIVEGAQFFMKLSNMDPNLIKGEPIIVVGTSAFKSWVRRIKRDTATDETISRFIYHLKKDVPMLFKYYFSNEKDLQKYIKNMQSNVNESYIEGVYRSKYSYSILKTFKEIEDFKYHMNDVFGEDPTHESIQYTNMIKHNGNLIGYIGFSEYTIDDKRYLGLGNFLIIRKYQRKGHGSGVIRDIIDKSKDKYDEIYCYVDKNNTGAIKFYKTISIDSYPTQVGYYVCLYKKGINTEATNYTTQETGISTIIFDIGDVLIRDNFKKFLKSDPDIPNELVDTIKSLWFIAKDDVDDTMDLETYREIVNKRMGVEFSKYIPKLFQYGVDAVEVLNYTIPMIQDLKDKGYKVYYLSNWSAWTHDLLQEAGKFDFLELMDGGVFSYDVGYRKPDSEIYQILLNRYKINPEEAVFFDDRKENIEAANKLGIYGVLFDKHDSAIVYNTLEQFHMSYQIEDVVDNSSTFTIHNYGSFIGQVDQKVQSTNNISKNHRYYDYDTVRQSFIEAAKREGFPISIKNGNDRFEYTPSTKEKPYGEVGGVSISKGGFTEETIQESVKTRNQIGNKEIKDIKTVINSLEDDSFGDFKFKDIIYCDIRYRDKKPIAFITIRIKNINNSTVGFVSLAVNPKYQNQGICKSLTKKAVSWFKKEKGIHFLEWHCLQNNEASKKLANDAGFRVYISKNSDEYIRYTMESSIQEYGTTGGTIVGTNQPDSVYIVNYMQNNVFSGHKEQKQAICKKGMNQMYTTKNGKSVSVDKNKFKEEASDVSVFRFKGSPFLSYDKIIESAIQDSDYYSLLTGDDISSPEYMKYDNRFIEEEPYTEYLDDITSCIESSIVGTQYSEEYPYMKVLTESVDGRCWNYYNDINGYFVMNELTGLRSPSYDSIEEIPESQIKVIERGTIYLGE